MDMVYFDICDCAGKMLLLLLDMNVRILVLVTIMFLLGDME